MLVLFNKPYGVLSQFTSDGGTWRTLADYIDIPDVYAAGRLDADSEGLLLLTDNGNLQAAIAGDRSTVTKAYWVQVEGVATDDHATRLARGVMLNDGPTGRAKCLVMQGMSEPWLRVPPISRRTVAKIRQNLFWAFAYNVAGIPLAAFGYLSPVMAGAAMAMSSVSVVTNALMLSRWKPGAK